MAEASSDHLRLLGGWFSPYAVRVQIALNIKSLQYEYLQENITAKSHLLLQSNPVLQKIPVLLHGDKAICESKIIVEYIDEVWTSASSILPSDPHDRANARFWASYIDDKWYTSLRSILFSEDEEAKKQYFEEVEEVIVRMEDLLEGKAFFGGEEIGLIDIVFGSFLSWLSVIETMNERKVLVESKAPELVKWAQRFSDDPNVKGLLPETEKLLEFAKIFQIQVKAAAAASK